MSEEFNPFNLSSGLPMVDADVTVKSIEFGYDATYAKGEACVAIVTFGMEEGEDAKQLYSVGKTFEPADRGSTLVHTSGKPTNLNNQSNYGRFVDALTKMDNAAEFMKEVRETGVDLVFNAAWLDGMSFHMGTVKLTMQDGKEKDLVIPVHYNGMAETSVKGKAKPKLAAKPAAKAKAKPEPDEDDEDYGVDDDDIRTALIEAAEAAADFEEYSEAALDVDGVMGNKVYQKAAVSSKPGSIWATFGGA